MPWVLPLLDVGTELTHKAIEDVAQRHELVDTVPTHHGQPSYGSSASLTFGFKRCDFGRLRMWIFLETKFET